MRFRIETCLGKKLYPLFTHAFKMYPFQSANCVRKTTVAGSSILSQSFSFLKILSGIVLITSITSRQIGRTYTVFGLLLIAAEIFLATVFGAAVSGPGVGRFSIIFVLTKPGFTVTTWTPEW